MAKQEPKGVMHIILDQDPTKVPEVQITGDWTHRQILALNQFVLKAFRTYMADKRREIKGVSDAE